MRTIDAVRECPKPLHHRHTAGACPRLACIHHRMVKEAGSNRDRTLLDLCPNTKHDLQLAKWLIAEHVAHAKRRSCVLPDRVCPSLHEQLHKHSDQMIPIAMLACIFNLALWRRLVWISCLPFPVWRQHVHAFLEAGHVGDTHYLDSSMC